MGISGGSCSRCVDAFRLPDSDAGELYFDLLRRMAAQTGPAGGKFVTLDGLDAVLKRIGTHDYRRRTEDIIVREFSFEGRWRIWTLFCGLLLTEWIVRKRRGLV